MSPHVGTRLPGISGLLLGVLVFARCAGEEPLPSNFLPLTNVSSAYGELITVGNHPTPDQHGTGERIAIFRSSDGTIWGLPIILTAAGEIHICAQPEIANAPVTDVLPADVVAVVGATNEPTGWRGGTGRLELVVRTRSGILRWHPMKSGETEGRGACWAPADPGPRQRLHYYRIGPSPPSPVS